MKARIKDYVPTLGRKFIVTLECDAPVDEKLMQKSLESDDGVQFSHTIEEQIGGQLRAGLTLRDVYGDIYPEGRLGQFNVPTFWATLSEK